MRHTGILDPGDYSQSTLCVFAVCCLSLLRSLFGAFNGRLGQRTFFEIISGSKSIQSRAEPCRQQWKTFLALSVHSCFFLGRAEPCFSRALTKFNVEERTKPISCGVLFGSLSEELEIGVNFLKFFFRLFTFRRKGKENHAIGV